MTVYYLFQAEEQNFDKIDNLLDKVDKDTLNIKQLTIKPNQLNYKVEFDPLLIFTKIKSTLNSNFYNHNRQRALSLQPSQFSQSKSQIHPYSYYTQSLNTNTPLHTQTQRNDFISFLKKLIIKFRFSDKTFYLSVFFIDTITSMEEYKEYRNNLDLNLIAISCLLLAYKFCENDPPVPNVKEFYPYLREQIFSCENICVGLLGYKLNHNTAFDYIQLIQNNGFILFYEYEYIQPSSIETVYQQCHIFLADFVCDLRFSEFEPFVIACACVYLVREIYKLDDKWPILFEKMYGIKVENFYKCYEIIKE